MIIRYPIVAYDSWGSKVLHSRMVSIWKKPTFSDIHTFNGNVTCMLPNHAMAKLKLTLWMFGFKLTKDKCIIVIQYGRRCEVYDIANNAMF